LELTIEKLIYGGDGLGRLPADEKGRGKAAFVPFTLPGEQVDARVTDETAGFVRASATRLIKSSPLRIEAACPYFQRCGGCHYQHADYREQLKIKEDILRENLRRLAKIESAPEITVHASPAWNYRNRTRLQVRTDSGFAVGYFKASSHELLPVERCPISSPLLNRALEVLWKLGRDGQVPPDVREVELFANDDDSQLQVELYVDPRQETAKQEPAKQEPQAFSQVLRGALPEVTSTYVFRETVAAWRGHKVQVAEEATWSDRPGEFRYRTRSGALRVSGGAFFQVNRFLVEELVGIVTASRSGDIALDLYAGVGLFSAALATSFRHIVAVESSQGSAADLKYNSPRNVKAVRSTVDTYLAAQGAKVRPDYVVVDPPRAGLGERVASGVAKLGAPHVTYVSCDPATLARDLITLTGAGYRVERLHLADLFPQTYHIESIVELAR
jgi:23S rRNA (uracil1939-C5)-methyltransferase